MPRPRKDRLFGPELPRIPARAFPNTLAAIALRRWDYIWCGEYVTPPCPPRKLLQALLESAYLAASSPEEDRFPAFNIVATPLDETSDKLQIGHRWPFNDRRPLTVAELRRLAPAVDVKKSAVWVQWSEASLQIAGLVDLGTSWHRARVGLEYNYQSPACLLIQVERPGRIRIYQGTFHVATLSDGTIEGYDGISLHLSLHGPANRGLRAMEDDLIRPSIEDEREFYGFEFLALWNTYAAIVNSISLEKHGGAVILVPPNAHLSDEFIKVKYAQSSLILRSAFTSFMNKRHVLGDLIAQQENGVTIRDEVMFHSEMKMREMFFVLVESTRFVAQLSRCDGAIVITDDLKILGFGAEIRAQMNPIAQVFEAVDDYDEMNRKYRRIDLEQFGMRHRSAIKLVSHMQDSRALVISQDGPISAVWFEGDKVVVRKGVNLVNMNMPWA
ncbi:MAG: hypothetical protein K0S06_4006 [Microvirga sp.]|nr:hypothetical protein [Microvirga sp.]